MISRCNEWICRPPAHDISVFAEGMRARTGFQSPKVREVLQLEEAALALKTVLSIHMDHGPGRQIQVEFTC